MVKFLNMKGVLSFLSVLDNSLQQLWMFIILVKSMYFLNIKHCVIVTCVFFAFAFVFLKKIIPIYFLKNVEIIQHKKEHVDCFLSFVDYEELSIDIYLIFCSKY